MANSFNPDELMDRTVVGADGDKIGSVGQVYLNDATGQPDWVTVNTGLFGMKENFVPLQGAQVQGGDLLLPFGKDVVKDAPSIDDTSHLDVDEQETLYSYYSQYLSETTSQAQSAESGPAYTESAPSASEDSITRSEEHLRVGTEQVEAGRARLRKYVVTEQQTVTVPVSHEEVVVEREPITDANRGDALGGAEISEAEHEVVLHAERPVVTTEAEVVERVRLGTRTVTEQEQVSGEVRKEQIELDEPGSGESTSRR
ncbi:DUF2382 domain-containing protein [Nakamurella sp. YIM 132087]|uniref:DUF2382 domain-containing protein n=1 Tax=Nakamurella alba TaxID=2665158 RepID=A0A7K1FSX5_9ACTN|nr:PRC and DUF2382 domain-containing protein [Nakamurella alba]MTD17211.1 DUF2382 domain-containing protein [Nakamurella alba]